MTKVAVFGAGSWGTAFSVVLADAGNDVSLWARRPEVAEAINSSRVNADYHPDVQLAPSVTATHDVREAAAGAEVVVLATPSQALRTNLSAWAPHLPTDAILVSLMKGVELGTLNLMTEVIAQETGAGPERIAVVSGPNLSPEIARREPAAAVVACAEESVAQRLQQIIHTRRSGPIPRPMCSAASSVVRTRTWSPSPSGWPSASASATTPPPRSSPVGWPRRLVWRCGWAPTR
jgi:glycerol-3-phosphate dehydrogenase (NAD(P)+)